MGHPLKDILSEHPHRRLNALTGEWILASPHRTKRPWQGQCEQPASEKRLEYDPKCYLCPGNERAAGVRNPPYTGTFVFENDFAAILPDTPDHRDAKHPLFHVATERGTCRVICFSPRHDLSLALMKTGEIRHVVDVWVDQYQDLASKPYIQYVQIFENRGAIMGCSNPHPHGQIWCNSSLPTLPSAEDVRQREYFEQYHRRLLDDYLAEELRRQERLIFENDHFAVLVPFWAVWPFESIVLPKVSSSDMTGLQGRERDALAETLQRLGVRYDNLFQTSFPYSMGIHQRPTDKAPRDYWGWHIHYFPPLLRSATVKKFMVGYEMLAMPQRDITPEQSAERLRACSERHYLTGESAL